MQTWGAGMCSHWDVTTSYMLPDAFSFPPCSSSSAQRHFCCFIELRKGHALFSNSFCPLVLHFPSSMSQEKRNQKDVSYSNSSPLIMLNMCISVPGLQQKTHDLIYSSLRQGVPPPFSNPPFPQSSDFTVTSPACASEPGQS